MSLETTRLLTEVLTERVDELITLQFPCGRGTTPFKSPSVSSLGLLIGEGANPILGQQNVEIN